MLKQGKSEKEEGAAETKCYELTVTPIPNSPPLLQAGRR